LCLCAIPFPAAGHHSRAEFTGEVIELKGELIDVSWRNPHPSFRIRLDDADSTVWDVQVYGSERTLTETGIESAMFEIGQEVTFAGPASNRRRLLLGTHALLSDGTEAILQYNTQSRWGGVAVGGSGTVIVDRTQLVRAASENRGFFRAWNTESTEIAVSALIDAMRGASYTEAARAATANWDLTSNPITRCEPSWMPWTMMQPVDLELTDNGASLTLNNAYFESSRTIHMDGAPASPDRPLTRMGSSRGRLEGNSLVIETDRIAAPAFNGVGVSQSEQMRVVERFTLSADQSRLDYEMTMTDPLSLNEPLTYRTYYLALNKPFNGDFDGANCD
jgi:hypothetical protein